MKYTSISIIEGGWNNIKMAGRISFINIASHRAVGLIHSLMGSINFIHCAPQVAPPYLLISSLINLLWFNTNQLVNMGHSFLFQTLFNNECVWLQLEKQPTQYRHVRRIFHNIRNDMEL